MSMTRNRAQHPPRAQQTPTEFDGEFAALADERSGPCEAFEQMEVVVDDVDWRPESGLDGVPELRWLPYAGVGLAAALGLAFLVHGLSDGRPAATVVAQAENLQAELAVSAASAATEQGAVEATEVADAKADKTAPAKAKASGRIAALHDPAPANSRAKTRRAHHRGPATATSTDDAEAAAGSEPATRRTPSRPSTEAISASATDSPDDGAAETPSAGLGMLPPPPDDEADEPTPRSATSNEGTAGDDGLPPAPPVREQPSAADEASADEPADAPKKHAELPEPSA